MPAFPPVLVLAMAVALGLILTLLLGAWLLGRLVLALQGR
jgi:hypothetical protein